MRSTDTSISIHLPMPDKALSPNARVHWATKSRAVKSLRGRATLLALAALGGSPAPHWRAADVTIVITPPDRRNRDRDNLLASLKGAFDGAQDAGIVIDDSGFHYQPIVLLSPDRSKAGVAIGFAMAQVGKKYDYLGVARFVTRRPSKGNEKWFCSELVFEAFRRAGVNLFHRIEAWEVSPSMISYSPLLTPLAVARQPLPDFATRADYFLRDYRTGGDSGIPNPA